MPFAIIEYVSASRTSRAARAIFSSIVTRPDGTSRKSRSAAAFARRVHVPGSGGQNPLRWQGALAAQPREILFSRIALDGRQNRLAGPRDCGPGLNRRRQRKKSPRAREQSDQASYAEIQRSPARRQNLSLHPLHRIREISASVCNAPAE